MVENRKLKKIGKKMQEKKSEILNLRDIQTKQ